MRTPGARPPELVRPKRELDALREACAGCLGVCAAGSVGIRCDVGGGGAVRGRRRGGGRPFVDRINAIIRRCIMGTEWLEGCTTFQDELDAEVWNAKRHGREDRYGVLMIVDVDKGPVIREESS